MTFASVRSINQACEAAAYGKLGGKYVYFRHRDETTGQTNLVRISRARYSQKENKLYVRHRGEWHRCKYEDVVAQ